MFGNVLSVLAVKKSLCELGASAVKYPKVFSACGGDLRLPLTPMAEGNLGKLKQAMRDFGLI